MDQLFRREAIYWRAFALLALVNKRDIMDFQIELARSSAGMFVSDDDLEAVLNEFYLELGQILSKGDPEV
jgi:hypothetical protein